MWSDRPYPPFIMSLVTAGTVFGFKKIFKQSKIKQGRNYWLNGSNSYYYPADELNKTVDRLCRRAVKEPDFLLDLLSIGYDKAVKLKLISERYKVHNLARLSNDELLKITDDFSKMFSDFYSYGTVSSLLGYQDENLIYKKFNEIIRSKTENQPEKFSDYLVILSNPPRKLKSNFLELNVLKIAASAKKKKLKNKKQILKYFLKDLKRLEKNYAVMSFDFCDKLSWNLNHFAKLALEKLSGKIKENILKLKHYEKNTAREFSRLAKKLKLSKQEIKICDLIRNLGYYKWKREYEFQEAFYNLKFIQDEIGRRLDLTTLEIKYLLANELKPAIKQPAKYVKIARARIKNSLNIVQVGRGIKILVRKKAKAEFKKMEIVVPEYNLNLKELKGMPACSGQAKGRVKIINAAGEMKKMKKGDILVSQATSPELLPAMKIAAAIITNEGGITSHAAIVSRELKIPCIVGAKIATKVLHDGDSVEVDADKGIVHLRRKATVDK